MGPGQRDPGEDGALSKLYYTTRGREMILTETVVANRLPKSFEAYYHHDDVDNTLNTTFTVLSENRTRYEIEGGTPRTGSPTHSTALTRRIHEASPNMAEQLQGFRRRPPCRPNT
jgi:hypothetical protein